MQKKFILNTPVESAEFTVRDDHTLAVKLIFGDNSRTLVFHDFIRKGGKRYYLFNNKTEILSRDNCVEVRTATMEGETGEPIRGLFVTYRFTFDRELTAFYLSADYGCDVRCSGYSVRLMDVSWEDLEVVNFTGYEYDAEGKPFSHTFSLPEEENPIAPDYEDLMVLRPHVAWERMKTRPVTFTKAVAVNGSDGYFAIFGGTPTYHIEAKFVQTFSEMASLEGDLRYFSGKNSPGAWFILEKPQDLFPVMDALEARKPELPEQVMVPFDAKTLELSAGQLRLKLLQTESGIWVTPFYAGAEIPCQPWPLFSLDLWDTQHQRPLLVDSGNSWDKVDVLQKGNYVRITLSDPDCGRTTGITVVAEAFLEPKLNRISWKTKVVNRSDRWSVTKASYPQCLVQGFSQVFTPVSSGEVTERFNARSCTFRGKYPTGVSINMAYTALYNPVSMEDLDNNCNGFYMGIHDPDGTPKFIYMLGAPQSDCTLVSTECDAPYRRHAGNSFTLPGTMVWQCFRGDWFDATEIYRNFVFTQSKWLSPLRGREDTPQWLRETPVWIMHFMPNENPDANPFPITLREKYADKNPEDWYRLAVKFRQEVGVPVTYHLYNWHWVPFNNDNPHYFPGHHDLKAGMRELKNADIRVIPYIAGYSWDMCDCRGDDYRFETEALPATAKNLSGDPIFSSYASTEPTGQFVRFARMCPSTTVWKNEIQQIAKKLYKDYGMDGIYLDVVSTAYEQCCDETHLHAPGHGDFWWKAYAELIAGLRAVTPEEFAVVSESTSEVYSGVLDGYLSWVWVRPDSVPAHSRIYGGRTAIFGRVFTNNTRDNTDYFRFNIAQSLVYGQQLGWLHPEIVDDPDQFPFLKKMAKIRWDYREFFAEAEMLRPPVVEGNVPLLNCEPFLRGQIWNHEKLVQAGGWEDAQDNRSLFVINAADSPAEFTLSVYESEYQLPENIRGFDVQDGITLLEMTSEYGVRKLRCKLEPCGYGILNWRA